MESHRECITIYTVFDITNTGVRNFVDSDSDDFTKEQNFKVIFNVLNFRTQVEIVSQKIHDIVPSEIGLGSKFNKKQPVWELVVIPLSTSPWNHDSDPLYHLVNDMHGAPMSIIDENDINIGNIVNCTSLVDKNVHIVYSKTGE